MHSTNQSSGHNASLSTQLGRIQRVAGETFERLEDIRETASLRRLIAPFPRSTVSLRRDRNTKNRTLSPFG
jgi:hypothetical protein